VPNAVYVCTKWRLLAIKGIGGHWLSTELVVALLALTGTLAGSFSGILVSNKLVNYRLEQLERKVEKHNNLVERIAMAENELKLMQREIEDLNKEIEN
jgi:hypothetical protein